MTAVNRLGYAAVGCSNVESALAVVRETPSLQLLLSDICLQSTTGPEFIRQALRDRPDLKVIFMTGGFGDISFRGTDRVLNKPFPMASLKGAIEDALDPTRTHLDPPTVETERRRYGHNPSA